jgi:hypothetical protein
MNFKLYILLYEHDLTNDRYKYVLLTIYIIIAKIN